MKRRDNIDKLLFDLKIKRTSEFCRYRTMPFVFSIIAFALLLAFFIYIFSGWIDSANKNLLSIILISLIGFVTFYVFLPLIFSKTEFYPNKIINQRLTLRGIERVKFRSSDISKFVFSKIEKKTGVKEYVCILKIQMVNTKEHELFKRRITDGNFSKYEKFAVVLKSYYNKALIYK